VSVPAVTRQGSLGRAFAAAATPLLATGHSIVSVPAVTRHGSLGHTFVAAAAPLLATGHSIVSVPAVTRHGSLGRTFAAAAPLLATGHSIVSVPAEKRHGSRVACSQVSPKLAENAALLPATGHSIVSVPAVIRQGSRTAICFGQASEEKKEKKVKKSSDDHNRSFCHGILQKTAQVKADLNSGHREGSVAIGPDAIRGRLKELKNVLVIVQIKDENRTKYQSHLSNPFSYMSTDIDPPIIAHWFSSLGGGNDDNDDIGPLIIWGARNKESDKDDNDDSSACFYRDNGVKGPREDLANVHKMVPPAWRQKRRQRRVLLSLRLLAQHRGVGFALAKVESTTAAAPSSTASMMSGGSARGRRRRRRVPHIEDEATSGSACPHRICLPSNDARNKNELSIRASRKKKKKTTKGGREKKKEKNRSVRAGENRFPSASSGDDSPIPWTSTEQNFEGPRRGEGKKKKTEKKKNINSCHLVFPPSAVVTTTSGRLLTTQESLSLKAAATGCEQKKKKKKKRKKRVDFVLTMEQQRSSGTHFPRKRPHSL
jgi:hypothetical protein